LSPTSGTVLAARYRLDAPLGEGGMGQVWSATHLLTGRAVAIKRLLLPLGAASQRDARARFLLEAQSACAVEHANVVQVFDFIDEDGATPFIVMELLTGETLAMRLARESVLSLEQTATLMLPLVSAVGTAHALGIIHRDLKPSNIFLCSGHEGKSTVKVLDFGIAKWLHSGRLESSLRTQTGSTLGTPSYMSPEQATAERDVDHRTDVWSIGVILYECLSGARPVEGENAAQMVMRLLSSGIIPIEHLVPSLPEPLTRLIGRMLAREPARRLENLQELYRVLRGLTRDEAPSFGAPKVQAALQEAPAEPESHNPALISTPETTWTPATLAPDVVAQADVRATPARRSRARRSLSLALIGAALVGLTLATRGLLLPAMPAPLPVAQQPTEQRLDPAQGGAPFEPASAARVLAVPPEATANTVEPRAIAAPEGAAEHANEPGSAPSRTRGVPTVASSPRRAAKPKRPPPLTAAPRPAGAECDRSSECASRMCVAFRCE
jgi:eukaryotic-like serine/threonine-protein kinase